MNEGDVVAAPDGDIDPEGLIYASINTKLEFRQGEIISNVYENLFVEETGDVTRELHAFAIIASQDCDLQRDFDRRRREEFSDVHNVLLFSAYSREDPKYRVGNASLMRIVKKNDHERYHFLQDVDATVDAVGEGFGPLLVDFRKFFTVKPERLYIQAQAGEISRRCRLVAPYREHFQSRALGYLQRVSIPEPHKDPDPPIVL